MQDKSAEWLQLWKDAWEDGVSGRYVAFSIPGMQGGCDCSRRRCARTLPVVPHGAPPALNSNVQGMGDWGGVRLEASLGKTYYHILYLSSLWSETKQLRELEIPKVQA